MTQGGKRPGAGRPKIGNAPADKLLAIRVTTEEWEIWQASAKAKGKTITALVRERLKEVSP